jgi:hypothetical protein
LRAQGIRPAKKFLTALVGCVGMLVKIIRENPFNPHHLVFIWVAALLCDEKSG